MTLPVPRVRVAPVWMVRLLKFVGSVIVAAALTKTTVLVSALKVPLFSQAPDAPFIVSVVPVPPYKVAPAKMVSLPIDALEGIEEENIG